MDVIDLGDFLDRYMKFDFQNFRERTVPDGGLYRTVLSGRGFLVVVLSRSPKKCFPIEVKTRGIVIVPEDNRVSRLGTFFSVILYRTFV